MFEDFLNSNYHNSKNKLKKIRDIVNRISGDYKNKLERIENIKIPDWETIESSLRREERQNLHVAFIYVHETFHTAMQGRKDFQNYIDENMEIIKEKLTEKNIGVSLNKIKPDTQSYLIDINNVLTELEETLDPSHKIICIFCAPTNDSSSWRFFCRDQDFFCKSYYNTYPVYMKEKHLHMPNSHHPFKAAYYHSTNLPKANGQMFDSYWFTHTPKWTEGNETVTGNTRDCLVLPWTEWSLWSNTSIKYWHWSHLNSEQHPFTAWFVEPREWEMGHFQLWDKPRRAGRVISVPNQWWRDYAYIIGSYTDAWYWRSYSAQFTLEDSIIGVYGWLNAKIVHIISERRKRQCWVYVADHGALVPVSFWHADGGNIGRFVYSYSPHTVAFDLSTEEKTRLACPWLADYNIFNNTLTRLKNRLLGIQFCILPVDFYFKSFLSVSQVNKLMSELSPNWLSAPMNHFDYVFNNPTAGGYPSPALTSTESLKTKLDFLNSSVFEMERRITNSAIGNILSMPSVDEFQNKMSLFLNNFIPNLGYSKLTIK